MDTIASEISLDDEITVKSPAFKASPPVLDYYRYERDFLLGFQELCDEPLDGLIPEVTPSANLNSDSMDNASPSKTGRSIKFNIAEIIATPITYKKLVISPRGKTATTVNYAYHDLPPVGSSERSIGANSSVDAPSMVSLEWRAKKPRKEKPREHDSRRLAARQKQIDIGMNTVGYKRFCELVPDAARSKNHPKIPDINQVCSKRSWDGQVRKWRRQLHDFDPADEAGGHIDDQNAADRHVTGTSEDEDFSDNDIDEDEDEDLEEVVA